MSYEDILKDNAVVNHLIKNEDIIKVCFKVPIDVPPAIHLLRLCNDVSTYGLSRENSDSYSLSSLYTCKKKICTFCHKALSMKKILSMQLYDDIFGTKEIKVLLKYCKYCKLSYYPGFAENYKDKLRIYEKGWKDYGIFVSTFCTAFSNDFMDRSICLKQKCHATFVGRVQAYNMQHKYKVSCKETMDKRRFSEAYFKYIYILFKERYNHLLEINGTISEALDSDYNLLHQDFINRYGSHTCKISGCEKCLVIDGHMKAHRKVCKMKACTNDPEYKSVYCIDHMCKNARKVDDNNVQILLNEDEYHIEKILKKTLVSKKKAWLYEVKWQGYDKASFEPKENIPRILVELFEMFGDSTVPTIVDSHFEKCGVKYVNIKVGINLLQLPSCSLQVSEEAYYLPSPNNTCNTEKTKSRFYHRTGGVLVMGKPCGVVVNVDEIYGGESVIQVSEMIEMSLGAMNHDIECIIYDDACHLKRHVDKRECSIYPQLKKMEMKIDRFHFPNHVDPWCKSNMNPDNCTLLNNVNTEVMEQIFAWLKGYSTSLRYMKKSHYRFILLDILDRHNQEIISLNMQ